MRLHRINGVTAVSNTERLRSCKIIDSPTMLQAESLANTVIDQTGKEWKRSSLCMRIIHAVTGFYYVMYKVLDLFLKCAPHILNTLERRNISRIRPHLVSVVLSAI